MFCQFFIFYLCTLAYVALQNIRQIPCMNKIYLIQNKVIIFQFNIVLGDQDECDTFKWRCDNGNITLRNTTTSYS